MKCREVPQERAGMAPAHGVAEVILPVNSSQISVLYGVVLAATGVGGHQQITRGKWHSTAPN